jgi:hypothetical protein
MSTGLECLYIEWEPGKWYYVLEDYPGTKCGDWLDAATAEGPFASFEAAYEHLHANNANPGGFCREDYTAPNNPESRLGELIAEAKRPSRYARY